MNASFGELADAAQTGSIGPQVHNWKSKGCESNHTATNVDAETLNCLVLPVLQLNNSPTNCMSWASWVDSMHTSVKSAKHRKF